MTLIDRFDAVLNAAYRSRDETIIAALRPLRDEASRLEQERDTACAELAEARKVNAATSEKIRNAP